jgi:hypothetical protein
MREKTSPEGIKALDSPVHLKFELEKDAKKEHDESGISNKISKLHAVLEHRWGGFLDR